MEPPANVIEPSEEPVNITISPGTLDAEDQGPVDIVIAPTINDKIEEADENEENDILVPESPHELQS